MKKIITGTLLFQLIATLLNAQITPANNTIAIDVNQPENTAYTYDSAFVKCKSIGMGEVGISFPWPNLETSPGVYDFTFLNIANVYYPAYNTPVDLTIAPVNTNIKSVPSDLASTNFDNALMVSRFKKLLDSIFKHIPNLQLSSLVIGSEVDIYLGSNATLWSQYTSFYSQVAAYAKTLRPSLKVTCEATLGGLAAGGTSSYLQTLNVYSDYVGTSYYPLNTNFTVKGGPAIAADFATLIAAYPSKPIYFYQYGFPSAAACNSSPALQAQFIIQTFSLWDTYKANIKMIDFTWMHDYSPAAVNTAATYYGLSDPAFLGFLGSLGMRTYPGKGTNKPAFDELICQAKQRGYNTLTCIAGIYEPESKSTFSVYPNPVRNNIHVAFSNDASNYFDLKIMNAMGQEVLNKNLKSNSKGNTVDVSMLAPGIYFVSVTSEKQVAYNQRVVVIAE